MERLLVKFLIHAIWLASSFYISTGFTTEQESPAEISKNTSQYTFSWSFQKDSMMKPRGGTTTGEKIILDQSTNEKWNSIQENGLSKFERDRRAILAMSGGFRTSFDFLETLGFTEGHIPARPYQSWGTEYIYVVEDKNTFISLQHILVMYFQPSTDLKPEPMVMKHWRQDWHFEDDNIHTFQGFNTWKEKTLDPKQLEGRWSQSVYQVDDSPRYQSIGSWEHTGNYSSWESEETWRPLPRREFSVRSDYDVLVGTNKHTITPSGWVQEEENLKVKLEQTGTLASTSPILAKEIGLARYERILDHDWTPGDDYWHKTGVFWQSVRKIWSGLIQDQPNLRLDEEKLKSKPMFMTVFDLANKFSDSKINSRAESEIESAILDYLKIETSQ